MITSSTTTQFLSTPSARRATRIPCRPCTARLYFYPRPPRGGRRYADIRVTKSKEISIHALREEGDSFADGRLFALIGISIHALREEGDKPRDGEADASNNFYPRPPRGGRQGDNLLLLRTHEISIHALREEGDPHPQNHGGSIFIFLSTPSARRATFPCCAFIVLLLFLSTPSARRATICGRADLRNPHISIHALREEGD